MGPRLCKVIEMFNRPSKKTKSSIDESKQMHEKIIAHRNRNMRRRASMVGPSATIASKLEKFPIDFPANMVEVAHAIDEAWIPTETTIHHLINDGKWIFVDEKLGIVKRVE